MIVVRVRLGRHASMWRWIIGFTVLVVGPTACSSSTKPIPTLAPWDSGTEGYGQARPAIVFNGGDPSGRITDIQWQSWGGAEAVGKGVAGYSAGPFLLPLKVEPSTIVAFDLGRCDGKLVYRAIEWYFPAEHEQFDPKAATRPCGNR